MNRQGGGTSSAKTTDQIVGSRIGAQRRQLGFSISESLLASGLSRSDFEQIENGDKRPDPDQLSRIGAALKTTTAALLRPE